MRAVYLSKTVIRFCNRLLLTYLCLCIEAYGCKPAEMDLSGCTSAQLPESIQIYNLGTVYYFGMGPTSVDVQKACDLFEKSALMGYGLAQFNVGNCYRTGEGRLIDLEKAIYWYKQAVNNKVVQAKTSLGVIYLYGSDKNQYAEGVSLLSQATESENVRAPFVLGTAYYHGLGVEKNDAKAIELYEEAAQNGNSGAQALLSHIYSEGLYGVKPDKSKTQYWRRAVSTNIEFERGQLLSWTVEEVLADLYKKGLGVPKNEDKYKYYLELSSRLKAKPDQTKPHSFTQILIGYFWKKGLRKIDSLIEQSKSSDSEGSKER